MKKRMLITGISGLLGNNLAFCLKDKYEILGIYNEHAVMIDGIETQKVNICNKPQLESCINGFKPDIVVHCAAISNIEQCEANADLANKVNYEGTKNMTECCQAPNIKFIHVSTDNLYGDLPDTLRKETDLVDPPNSYGKAKVKAEEAALAKKGALVLRSNFFGWNIQRKHSIAEWIIHNLSNNQPIKCFDDVTFSSMYTFDYVVLLEKAIEKDLEGIYNIGASTCLSKYDFAIKLADLFGLDKSLIERSQLDKFDFKAKRHKHLALDISKLAKDIDFQPPTFEESLKHFHEDYLKNIPKLIKRQKSSYEHLNYIPYGRQSITDDDLRSVEDIVKFHNITQGPKVKEFEDELCKATQGKYCVAVNSGTSALHIACLAAEIKEGDEVITSPNSFVASANCVVYCKGTPVFADIDVKTYNIDPLELEKKITDKTKAIIPVHFAGQSCDMTLLKDIVTKKEKAFGHKIFIIEDASHALGSEYKNSKVGSCALSDMTVMSFHPVKHVTTGEGGAVFTKEEGLYRKLKLLRSHGITNNPDELMYSEAAYEDVGKTKVVKPWYYEQQFLGFNYRITDMQCALGISQLKRLDAFIKRRREIVNTYNEAFKDVENITIPFESQNCNSNFHLYVLLFDFENIGMSRTEFMLNLKEKGIQTQVHYIPIHTQPFYQNNYGLNWGDYSNAENYYEKCLSIPLFPSIIDEDVDKVIKAIKGLVCGNG